MGMGSVLERPGRALPRCSMASLENRAASLLSFAVPPALIVMWMCCQMVNWTLAWTGRTWGGELPLKL